MGKDVLVILMVAFGLFAVVMFILFFIYLKKYYNMKHLDDDYKKDLNNKNEQEEINETIEVETIDNDDIIKEKDDLKIDNKYDEEEMFIPQKNISVDTNEIDSDMEFIPIKKK